MKKRACRKGKADKFSEKDRKNNSTRDTKKKEGDRENETERTLKEDSTIQIRLREKERGKEGNIERERD